MHDIEESPHKDTRMCVWSLLLTPPSLTPALVCERMNVTKMEKHVSDQSLKPNIHISEFMSKERNMTWKRHRK